MRGAEWLAAAVMLGVLLAPVGAVYEADDYEQPQLPMGVVPNEVVVAFQDQVPATFAAWLDANGHEFLMQDDTLHWVSFRTVDADAADAAIATLAARSDVRSVERDGYVAALHVPNDPFYSSQWGFPVINAPQAWDVQRGSHDVVVAVLDTGVEGSHPDLAANVCNVAHASFVPGELALVDGHFHGTHVAGTIAGVSDNGVGVSGTSQSCIMAVKVLSQFGSGQWTWVAAGIRHAAENGADIISMSLGGGNPGTTIVAEAVSFANLEGVLVIAAAGNSGCSNTVLYPARYPGVMAVSNLNSATSVNGGSSCGPQIEIAAPGTSILSTWRNGGYGYATGTSMAAPHVSGVAALVKSEHPDLTGADLRCVLALTADDILQPGVDTMSGWGRLNAHRAVTLDINPLALAGAASMGNAPNQVYSCTPDAVVAILNLLP